MKETSKNHLIPCGSVWLTIEQASKKITRGEIEQGYAADPETIYGLVKAIRILLKEKRDNRHKKYTWENVRGVPDKIQTTPFRDNHHC